MKPERRKIISPSQIQAQHLFLSLSHVIIRHTRAVYVISVYTHTRTAETIFLRANKSILQSRVGPGYVRGQIVRGF